MWNGHLRQILFVVRDDDVRGIGMKVMTESLQIVQATPDTSSEVAAMVGKLLTEIMDTVGARVFSFDLEQTTNRLKIAIEDDRYVVFVARTGGMPVGFVALCESFALYAGGVFGTIPEFYVRPEFRSEGVGQRLMSRAKSYGKACGWTRLEVTTPPLPAFDKSLAFYEREGFEIVGGRKLKIVL